MDLHTANDIRDTLKKIEGHLKAFVILQVIREMEKKEKEDNFKGRDKFGNTVIDNEKLNEHKKHFVSRLYGDL